MSSMLAAAAGALVAARKEGLLGWTPEASGVAAGEGGPGCDAASPLDRAAPAVP